MELPKSERPSVPVNESQILLPPENVGSDNRSDGLYHGSQFGIKICQSCCGCILDIDNCLDGSGASRITQNRRLLPDKATARLGIHA